MSYITDILYWISTGLLVPVIVLLIALFVRSLLLIGSFFGQYIAIRKTEALLRIEFDALTAENMDTLADRLPKKSNTLVVKSIRKIMEEKDSPAHVSRLLADYEILADKDLATSKTLSKMGPMLGLMGTLIPMGPGLQHAGGFCYNCSWSVCCSHWFHHTASKTTLVSARYDQSGILV